LSSRWLSSIILEDSIIHGYILTRQKRQGGNIHLPCVNNSDFNTSITGNDIYIGMVHIANLENKLAHAIIDERNLNGNYTNLENFIQRIAPEIEQLLLLVKINAFSFTGKLKSQLLWEAHLLQKTTNNCPKQIACSKVKANSLNFPNLYITH